MRRKCGLESIRNCAALGVERVPDYTTLYRFLRRVDTEVVTHALTAAVARLPPAGAEGLVVAVDATGLAPTAASCYFVDLLRNWGAVTSGRRSGAADEGDWTGRSRRRVR